MRYHLVVVGKLREKWLQRGCQEYIKRLQRWGKVVISEVPDEPCPKGKVNQQLALEKEGNRILSRIKPRSVVVALDIQGKSLTSPGLAGWLHELSLRGRSDITFIVGGSLGLSSLVLTRADLRWSFSDLTFPHQLMRLILLEQIYRACKINAGETYHK